MRYTHKDRRDQKDVNLNSATKAIFKSKNKYVFTDINRGQMGCTITNLIHRYNTCLKDTKKYIHINMHEPCNAQPQTCFVNMTENIHTMERCIDCIEQRMLDNTQRNMCGPSNTRW